MIIKERKIPIRILMLEALERRLPLNHSKTGKIKEDLAKRKAGFHGEESLDYYLKKLPQKEYLILNDLRLINEENPFQIDTLIISSRFALILEVKNISGTLFFDTQFNQLIRTLNGEEHGFQDPLSQVQYQKSNLIKWLAKQQIVELPVKYSVIISNPASIIKTSPHTKNVHQCVFHVSELLKRLQSFQDQFVKEILPPKELKKAARLLLKNHISEEINILESYNIDSSELLTGIQCPNCSRFSMKRIKRAWQCPICKTRSKNSHVQALMDYFLLGHRTITNKQLCWFLHLQSSDIAKKILKSMNLPFKGSNKGRIYCLPENFFAQPELLHQLSKVYYQ